MTNSFARLASRTLCATALAALAATPAAALQDGTQVTMRINSDAPGSAPLELTIKSLGDKVRVDVDLTQLMAARGAGGGGGDGRGADAMGGMISGAFMLLQPGGKTAMVLPGMNMAIVMDAASMGSGNPMAGMMGGRGRGGAQIDVDSVVTSIEDLGAGERILGYATRRYRATSKASDGSGDGVVEMWMADIGALSAMLHKYCESFGGLVKGNSAGSVNRAVGAKIPKGHVPLRTVITATTNRGKTVTTVETTDIKRTAIDPAELDVPAGMNVMDPST